MRVNVQTFDGLFAALYEASSRSRTIDVAFWVRHVKSGDIVLEVGSGAGRLAWPLAESGVRYVGIEPAESMIAIANKALISDYAQHIGQIRFIRGALPDFCWTGPLFDSIILPYNVFNYFHDLAERRAVLRNLSEWIKTGGTLIIDSLLFPMISEGYHFVRSFEDRDGNIVCRYRTDSWDPLNLRQISVIEDVVGKAAVERHMHILCTGYISDSEMTFLLNETGFRIERTYFNYNDDAYSGQMGQRQFVCTKT